MVGGRFVNTSLRALLTAPRLDVVHRAQLRRAVRHPAVLADDVRALLDDHGLPVPTATPGDPVLLAATDHAGSLWTLARPGDTDPRPLLDGARDAWRVAGRVAARTLPVVGDLGALAERDPPRLTALSAFPRVVVLDGASFGLAFFLAHLSWATGVPLDGDLAATAEIDANGAVRPVARLKQKFEALRRWAPGVRRVLVASAQVDEARGHAEGLDIVAVAHVGEAWPRAFQGPALEDALAARWRQDPEAARQAADAFFRFVLREPGTALRWAGVHRAAARLREVTDGDARWRADVAHSIAGRHAGEPLPLPEPPAGLQLRRMDRLALLAHRVQAQNDAVADGWEPLADEASAELARPGDECVQDLKLLGALGRLYASWGRFDAARPLLQRAVDGWLDSDDVPEASYPLCELVRVEGLAGSAATLDRVERSVRRCVTDPRTTDHARTFLLLALGRARATLGDVEAARAALAETAAPWTETYAHVRASRLRWLARVDAAGLEAAGAARIAVPSASPHLGTLAALAEAEPTVAFVLRLAQADAGDERALDHLAGSNAGQLARCRRVAGAASLRRALDLFPY